MIWGWRNGINKAQNKGKLQIYSTTLKCKKVVYQHTFKNKNINHRLEYICHKYDRDLELIIYTDLLLFNT